jgi:glutathione S-transferase
MRRALSTRSCAGRTHVGAVSLRTPTSHTTTRRADAFPILRSLKESRLKLYYSPGACSLAVHIALIEADATFQLERVDLRTKKTESGADFTAINPKGYVPALALDSGEIVTENLAVLDWIATQSPALGLDGPLGRTRLLEALAFLSSEVHKSFNTFFVGGSEDETSKARQVVSQRLALLAETTEGPFPRISVADCYLFVMLLWAMRFDIPVPDELLALRGSMTGRPAVQKAMERDGLRVPFAEASLQRRMGVA